MRWKEGKIIHACATTTTSSSSSRAHHKKPCLLRHTRIPRTHPSATQKMSFSPSMQRAHVLSNFLLRFFVLFINFLYLCFFIFNFLCLFTLISCHDVSTPSSAIIRSRYCNCRSRMRPRKGWLRGVGGKYLRPEEGEGCSMMGVLWVL